ncbi:MAG TPA: signal peptide peptidase SppA [Hyphomicrobiales bacterium]|nr:signal peptide peptidase SppA [Hyphomicrobiales bacterium]
MSLDSDVLVDRRRLSRRVSLWRAVAFVLALAALASAAALIGGGPAALGRGEHVARIAIEGLITDDRNLQKLIERAARDRNVKALLLAINSPGGTTTGSEALYLAIREAAEKKPVVAVVGTVAASGGYIAAIAAERIIARGNSITGSIGVLFQWAQVSQALENLGIKFEEVKSAPLKAEPSPFTVTPEAARAVMREMVADSYQWFLDLVAERRGFAAAEARRLGDGRVYTGRQALSAGLIDAIGGEKEAVAWLAENKGLSATIKVRDWKASGDLEALGLLERAALGLARAFGMRDILAPVLDQFDARGRLRLDGLVSVWHAPQDKAD